jgi:hypothetical protein
MDELLTDDNKNSSESEKDINTIFTPNQDNTINLFTQSDTPEDNNVINKCNCKKYEHKIRELNNTINNMSNMLSETNVALKDRKVYIMKTNFININKDIQELAESTDIHCWWCCHQFTTPPCQLPEKFHEGKYYVFGCFCSYNCALAYNLDMDDYKTNERTSLLSYLYNEVYKNNIKLEPALPKKTLKMFGGPLTIEEYRKHFINNDKEFRFIMPPMISIIPLIEEDYKDKNKYYKSNKYIPLNNKLLLANENLKLKRSEPLPYSKYSLENTMGLIRKKDSK